jgi:hypothetical protein
MPDFAYVIQETTCPHCSQIVTPMVAFQWGFCNGPDGPRDGDYYLGDTIRWKECADKSFLAWTYFRYDGCHAGGNIGDSEYRDIITRATHYGFLYNWENEPDRRRCLHCHNVIEGIVIEIRDAALVRVWIYLPGEFVGDADYFVIRQDGQLRPMPEWNDRPMPIVDC